ncbi:MAG: WD40 repeat domain-containing protein [Candidatus Poribacteria bacterium]|nr:WD40 repeat domain-containing protein [Candidatus Poribacteria bacterium]
MKTVQLIISLLFLIIIIVLPNSFAADFPHTVLEGHTDSVFNVTYTLDGKILASKSKDGTIKIWNPTTRLLLRTINTNSGGGIAFSPDGSILASGGGEDQVINLFDPNTGELLKTLKGHQAYVSDVIFSSDGSILASGDWDGRIRLWNPETGEFIRILNANKLGGIAFHPDSSILVNAGGSHENLKVWDTMTGKLLHTLEPEVFGVYDVSFSHDGSILASVGWGGMDLWDANSGESLRSFPRDRNRLYLSVAFSPDGKIIACGKDFEGISLWDTNTGVLLKNLRIDTEDVNDLEFSPDGKILASASNDNMVRLWEITKPEEVEPPPPPDFLIDENLKTWSEDFGEGNLKSWKRRELQRERVTWKSQNNQLHIRTKVWCNGRLNLNNRLEEQTNYTLRFTAFPFNVEQIRVKLDVVSTSNANVGIFLGKDPQDEIKHPFNNAYQFADHVLGSPEEFPRTSAPKIALDNLVEIDVVFDRGHFYLFSDDEYIIDFKIDPQLNDLQTIDLLGIAVFPRNCRQVAHVVVDNFIISGPTIPDSVSLNVGAKGKVSVLWGKLKQY